MSDSKSDPHGINKYKVTPPRKDQPKFVAKVRGWPLPPEKGSTGDPWKEIEDMLDAAEQPEKVKFDKQRVEKRREKMIYGRKKQTDES